MCSRRRKPCVSWVNVSADILGALRRPFHLRRKDKARAGLCFEPNDYEYNGNMMMKDFGDVAFEVHFTRDTVLATL